MIIAHGYDRLVDAERAARAWIEAWTSGLREHEIEPITALYAEDGVCVSPPSRLPKHGPAGVREYVEWAFAEEDDVELRFGDPVAGGDRAAVEYWAVITYQGKRETLIGTALLRFDEDGRVVAQRDYWQMETGEHEPALGWGFS